MPWSIEKRGDQFCVVKQGASSPVPGGCHATREKAIKHQRALYASEQQAAEVTEMATAEAEQTMTWRGSLGMEGVVTSDRRYLIPGEIGQRDLPLTLMAQTVNAEGHGGAQVAGKITRIWRDPGQDGSMMIMGEGEFDNSDFGRETARMVQDEVLRGVSLDLAITDAVALDSETLEPLDQDEMDLAAMLTGDFVSGLKGEIAGATIVAVPAFDQAVLKCVPTGDKSMALVSSATIAVHRFGLPLTEEQINGAAEGIITLLAAATKPPPRDWFENPGLHGPQPLTYTDDGRVYGHLALWDQCHTGYQGVCVSPPASPTDYAYFNTGLFDTDDGTVTCGKLMFSKDGGKHAPLEMSASQASRHYDDSSKVGAFVRAGSDSYGIWLAGALKPGLSKDDLAHLKAHPPSGDWRGIKGASELVAAFSVPVPGFPIPQTEARLVASGERDEITALIIPPMVASAEELSVRTVQRKMQALKHRRAMKRPSST